MDFSNVFKNLDLDKALDKAFDLEKVGGSVFNVVDEFPDRAAAAAAPLGGNVDGAVLTASSVARARQGLAAWEELNLEVRVCACGGMVCMRVACMGIMVSAMEWCMHGWPPASRLHCCCML